MINIIDFDRKMCIIY